VVLNNISLEILQGEVVFLLGHSGEGKSTLLRTIAGLEKPDVGNIIIDNEIVETKHLHHFVGMVFQHYSLFPHLSVKKNITIALEIVKKKTKQESSYIADQLLHQYNLFDKAHDSISLLSGGQKQRLALARALALDPHIICMDEPTSALDPHLTQYVGLQIKELSNRGKTLIVTTHNTDFVKNYLSEATVYFMHKGSIKEKTTVDNIKNNIFITEELRIFFS
jgi:polar amino acid transport system ATP-binding protein